MSTYTSFAVVGAGVLGADIVKALLARNVSVVVLKRPSSNKTDLPESVKVVPVDYSDRAAVERVLREHKIQVVVSTVSGPPEALSIQEPIADAAKAAGVQLFVPSEFGMPSGGHIEGLTGVKSKVADHLRAIGLPSARIYNGLFIEYIGWLTAVEETKTFNIVGKGDSPVTFTAIPDIAGFVAHVLTTHPLAKLANTELRIQGERATFNEVAKLFNAPVRYVDAIPSNVPLHEHRTWLAKAMDSGWASTGWSVEQGKEIESDAGSANGLWEGHDWLNIKQTLKL